MKHSLFFFAFLILFCANSFGQLDFRSPEFKTLSLIINHISSYHGDKVFENYPTKKNTNVFYNKKNVAINYTTLHQKFDIDTFRHYKKLFTDEMPDDHFNIFNVIDTGRVHMRHGDVIVSIFEPSYFNGYYYVVAFARKQGSDYGSELANFLVIFDEHVKIVEFYYLKGKI